MAKQPKLPTTVDVKSTKPGMFRLLGYRALVETFPEDRLNESWLYIPEGQRHKFKAARVIQTGRYTITKKRPPMEFKKGDKVLIDQNYGSQEVKEGNRVFLIVSAHDVAAILG